jgi:hypothetical protein
MPLTMEQVLASLQPDEPNYNAAKGLGPEALPHLRRLVEGRDPMLASKATYLAGLIGGQEGMATVMAAARSADVTVRAAAAGAVAHMPEAGPVLARLLEDAREDVRRIAVQSVRPDVGPDLRARLERIAEADPDSTVRGLARDTLRRLRRQP